MSYRLAQNLIDNTTLEAIRIVSNVQALSRMQQRPRIYVLYTKDNHQARSMREMICSLLQISSRGSFSEILSHEIFPVFYPSHEFSRFDDRKNDIVNISERILALHQLEARLKQGDKGKTTILLASSQTAIEKNIPLLEICAQTIHLKLSETRNQNELMKDFQDRGYKKVVNVKELGQFATRGSIVDIYSPLHYGPMRLEFSHETLVGIRQFDLDSQRSEMVLDEVRVSSCVEFAYGVAHETFFNESFLPLYRSLAEDQNISTQKIRLNEEFIKNGSPPTGALEIAKQVRSKDLIPLWQNFHSDSIFLDTTSSFSYDISHAHETLLRDVQRAQEAGVVAAHIDKTFLIPEFVLNAVEHFRASQPETQDKLISEARRELPVSNKKKDAHGVLSSWLEQIKEFYRRGFIIIICISSKQRFELMANELLISKFDYEVKSSLGDILFSHSAQVTKNIVLCNQSFDKGFAIETDKIVCVTEGEIFSYKPLISKPLPYKRASFRTTISNLGQLHVGDIVVHELYGIGKFLGLRQMERGDSSGEYLEVEYGGGSKLYVPIYDFLKVGKYQSSDSGAPPLTMLGSGKWELTKQKIKAEIASLTGNLLKTHAMRSLIEGFQFKEYKVEEELLAETFPYVETVDQLKAISDVMQDMSSGRPMDRLVCGDVGFGKTEVAIRAAYRCVLSGRQVAFVAPTTLLVDQHLKNFIDRFADFGVSVAGVNRFRQKSEIKQTLRDLEDGKIDIVIGTHRLLQKDVRFKNLGLLVIDEEHKFGVAQKESLKNYRVQVDVLTLSATPIPRTLQQALHGTRELSVIETPPYGRQTVSIRVDRLTESLLLEAIDREVSRGGQVYIVQHLITGLEQVKELVSRLCPDVSCELAHGRMKGDVIESVMQRFYEGTTKILLSTAIVDSGLDVPNANTMIVLNPQDFGLAQLYQLKGRVGRGDKKAMSYFLYDDFSKLTDDSKRRLAVLEAQETSGSGFKLSLQDMEIRGAGSLFGKDQTGHAQAIGFDMYFKILEEAVSTEKKRRLSGSLLESDKVVFEPDVKLHVDMHIPDETISDLQERLIFYQRSLDIHTEETYRDYLEEFQDRYGFVTPQVENFLSSMLIRNFCKMLMIGKLEYRETYCNFNLVSYSKELAVILHKDRLVKHITPLGYTFLAHSVKDVVSRLSELIASKSRDSE